MTSEQKFGRLSSSLAVVLIFAAVALSQQSTPAPTPAPNSTPSSQQPPIIPRAARTSQVFGDPRPGSALPAADGLAARQLVVQEYASQVYRKPTDDELDAIAPRAELVRQWSEFLKLPDTGIVRLLPESGCGQDTKVISAAEDCLKFSMPGGGSSYSFRAERYRVRHLADLTLARGMLRSNGILMHGVIVALGDRPIEGLSLQSEGIKYLADFKPVPNYEAARNFDRNLGVGIRINGLIYRRIAAPVLNTTYAMRSIAFRGKVMRSVRGAPYNELDFDRRRDVIVVFRVVDITADGAVTMVWRELADIESPKLKIPPREPAKRNDG
jgi:hypothetical protein